MEDQMSDEKDASQYEVKRVFGLPTYLDPELQNALIDCEAGLTNGADEVSVTAILKDPQVAVPGLNKVQHIGRYVTGTVKVADIATVRSNVFSLKSAKKLYRSLGDSVPEIRASQEQLNTALAVNSLPVNGSGVIVGVVDHGCDFVHRNLRNADGTTRLLFLWDQNQQSEAASTDDCPYGKEFDSEEINKALAAPDAETAHQQLGYRVGDDAHGTFVLDIAAGNGMATKLPGVAPQADIIFVELKQGAASEPGSLGDSRRLLDAVKYIFDKADKLKRSGVVNVSLNANGGPHDGSTPVERAFDELLRSDGRAIVVAAGNTLTQGGHASGTVNHEQPRVLHWVITANDKTDNKLEVWYGGAHRLEVTLITPEGEVLGTFPLGETQRIFRQGIEVARVFHRLRDPNNNDNQVFILFLPTMPAGTWGVSLSSSEQQEVEFHAWIERGTPGQSFFAPADVDRAFTIGSIACGVSTITVGSYAALNQNLAEDSSQGPTRDAKRKPEVSAPGVWVRAARSLTQSFLRSSGTSASAAHVTGIIAMLMQASPVPLTTKQIRDAVIDSARKDPPSNLPWDSRYGFGRVDAIATVLTQINPATPPLPASATPATNAGAALTGGGASTVNQRHVLRVSHLIPNEGVK